MNLARSRTSYGLSRIPNSIIEADIELLVGILTAPAALYIKGRRAEFAANTIFGIPLPC